ncbi:CRISPR associated protein Csc3 [Geitlerinema sp. FC II]|nr:CRISPR associated protein Csc3 [Geitlerinema sp. FC II]
MSSQSPENSQQLNLFDMTNNFEEFEEFDFESLSSEDLGSTEEEGDRTIELSSELLTLKLLQEAIDKTHPEDLVMAEFAKFVLPNLLKYTIGVTAKGGWFFEELDRRAAIKKIEAVRRGNTEEEHKSVRRDNAADQSLNTHILNGLFPANAIERKLQTLNTTVRRVIDDFSRKIGLAGFVLHDFEKFDYHRIPEIPDAYRGMSRDIDRDIRKLSLDEHRQLFDVLVPALGIDRFLFPDNPQQWRTYRDDLLAIAYNTQAQNDTNLNFSNTGLNPELRDRTLKSLIDLTCLADRLASIIKHPQDVEKRSLLKVLDRLSDGELKFTYHAISENRGVLTNIVNNAVMDAHRELDYTPLLYLPTGVIYMTPKNAEQVSLDDLPDRVVSSIKTLCAGELRRKQTGFGRDGKGMKYADYYSQFFDDRGLMEVALDATLRILKNKKPVSKSRSDNLKKFQTQGVLSENYDFNFEDDIRIDRIAEFGDVATRKIWGDRRSRIEAYLKETHKGKKAKEAIAKLPDPNFIIEIAKAWKLDRYIPQIREIQQINETLKRLKLKGNTGGVPYEWYFLAAKYLEENPGQSDEDIQKIGEQIIGLVLQLTAPIVAEYDLADGWDDLRDWTRRVVVLPGQTRDENTDDRAEIFLKELENYQAAKKPGRGRQLLCSLSHSPYSVSEQMESAVLFTPQVYTNKQMLGGSNAKRNISSIAGTEMMLRQILMNQTQTVGKRFEDGKYRYLYFYPTYYFTPETNNFIARAYANIAQTRFNAAIRDRFIDPKELKADLSLERYQTVDAFIIDEDLQEKVKLPEGNPNRKSDRTFKLSYPEDKPLTFYFIALPPGREPTDTESWVMPAWLALAFPNILDVKTVVSESPIPPFRDGAEFEETVFLDSAPQAFRVLLKRDRFRLHHLLEGWPELVRNRETSELEDFLHPSPLNTLTAAYTIHLDVNIKRGKKGYDANWGKFAELANNLETSPLYVFSYLAKRSRARETDAPSPKRIQLYVYDLYPCFDPYVEVDRTLETLTVGTESPLNHPKKLVELYRKFYRANKKYNPKSNAVLKPIDIASDTLLKAETSVFHGETLVAVVAAEVFKLMDRVRASNAEGYWQIQDREAERQAVLAFSRYFVEEVFEKAFKGDRARLAGTQLNLLRDTCEFLYRLEQDKENKAEKEQKQASEAKTEKE